MLEPVFVSVSVYEPETKDAPDESAVAEFVLGSNFARRIWPLWTDRIIFDTWMRGVFVVQ